MLCFVMFDRLGCRIIGSAVRTVLNMVLLQKIQPRLRIPSFLFNFTVDQLVGKIVMNGLQYDLGMKMTACEFNGHNVGSDEC